MVENIQYYDNFDYNQEFIAPEMHRGVNEAFFNLHEYVEVKNTKNKNKKTKKNKKQEIHSHIANTLKQSQEEFLFVYKEQMTKIQQELKTLKKRMDEEILRQKSNDKINNLTEEKNYFKEKSLRLDK